MTIKSYHVRNMLLSYDKHLVNARRLARFRRAMRAAGGEDDLQISQEAKRHELVERVAKEIVENLIITGTDNPLVTEIKARLETDFGQPLRFTFPPSEEDIQIFRELDAGPQEILGEEKHQILNRLWQVTLDKVNDTML